MELLAPAGNVENFHAAIEAGADAVYVGAPGCNARNLARDLRLEEIGAMIHYCHDHGKKLYLAANSLIVEKELPQVIETLALLESFKPDAFIVQDLGIIQLVRAHFPEISLHASTLMLAHNRECIHMLSRLGCERVVLARELTLKEIKELTSSTDTELEVFVHGAMCFSYSGLCLFSSYLGGKSGLRGRCVQPCRRRYTWQGKKNIGVGKKGRGGSYLFSMNDLRGLQVIPALRDAGVASMKIEGRLRSAHYVSHVVRAYRSVLDANEDEVEEAIDNATTLVEKAMSRKMSSGYFFSPNPQDAVIPYHSGNIGSHVGRMDKIEERTDGDYGQLKLKESVGIGDRLRLHFEASGNRKAFTLKELLVKGKDADRAREGDRVLIALPKERELHKKGRVELYKVDERSKDTAGQRLHLKTGKAKQQLEVKKKQLGRRLSFIEKSTGCFTNNLPRTKQHAPRKKTPIRRNSTRKGKGGLTLKHLPLELWLKTDNVKNIQYRMPFAPDHFLLSMERSMTSQASQIKRLLGKGSRKVIWALPPVLLDAELRKAKKQIRMLMRTGFKSFQLGHISQISLFGGERVHLYGDYTLNLMNNQAVHLAGLVGMSGVQLAIESDRDGMRDLVAGSKTVLKESKLERGKLKQDVPSVRLGLTVYGSPSLFTTRLSGSHFQYNKTLTSPKGETFTMVKKEGGVQVHSTRPFSLLPFMHELKAIGIDYMVVDITGRGAGKRELQEISERLSGKGRFAKLPTFNYLGKLE